jgi:hypothetical protein
MPNDKEQGSAEQPQAEPKPAEPKPKVHISALFGSLKDKTTVRLTVEEINAATARGWAGKS